jgi:hypothetical protein
MRRAIAALGLGILAACGSGGATHATTVLPTGTLRATTGTSSKATASATFTITVPAKAAQAVSRKPQYVSVNTQSVVITLQAVNGTVYAGTGAIIASNLTTTNPACSGASGTLTCTIVAPAVPGGDTFMISTYDAQQTTSTPTAPAGNVLSNATAFAQVVAGQANSFATALVLNGVAASTSIAFATDTATAAHVSGSEAAGFQIVGNQPYTITPEAFDASGARIIGDGAPTFSLGTSSSAVAFTAAGSSDSVQVMKYSATPIALTVTPSNGTPLQFNVTTVQELWIGCDADMIYGFKAGTTTPIAGDTITDAGSPWSLAVAPNGDLFAANHISSTVSAYVPGTNQAVTSESITGLNGPTQLAFDPTGDLYVTNGFSNGPVQKFTSGTYALSNASFVTSGGAIGQAAFDSTGDVFIPIGTNVAEYSPTGTPINPAFITGLSSPFGMVVDESGNFWIDNFGAGTVNKYGPTGSALGVSIPQPSTSSQGDIAIDASGNVWITYPDIDTISPFTSTGSPIAGETISAPAGIPPGSAPLGIAFTP